ncbi:hypothetical protein [Roseovarius salinarum]|nr:hypothetical protein [Roseovarius salinarum]
MTRTDRTRTAQWPAPMSRTERRRFRRFERDRGARQVFPDFAMI